MLIKDFDKKLIKVFYNINYKNIKISRNAINNIYL